MDYLPNKNFGRFYITYCSNDASPLEHVENTFSDQNFFPFPHFLQVNFFLKVIKTVKFQLCLESLPNNKILDLAKLKASANNKINVTIRKILLRER